MTKKSHQIESGSYDDNEFETFSSGKIRTVLIEKISKRIKIFKKHKRTLQLHKKAARFCIRDKEIEIILNLIKEDLQERENQVSLQSLLTFFKAPCPKSRHFASEKSACARQFQ